MTGRTAVITLCMIILVQGYAFAAEDQIEEPRYLDVSSQGYSRFEISQGDVVAFYTDGVEFSYLNIEVQAENLRYNHASQEAVVEGVTRGKLDQTLFQCNDLYLNGEKGVMEIQGGIKVDHAGTIIDCETIKANFPGGATRLSIDDLIVVAGPDVDVITFDGHLIHAPELIFTGRDRMITTEGSTQMRLALEDFEIQSELSLNLAGLVLEYESMFCELDEEMNPCKVELNHISGFNDDITFTATRLQAIPDLESINGTAEDWNLVLTNMDSELTIGDDWLSCSAVRGECSVNSMSVSAIELSEMVRVRTGKGAFIADRASAYPTETGFELFLPEDVTVDFNLARMSGQDPIGFVSLGEDDNG